MQDNGILMFSEIYFIFYANLHFHNHRKCNKIHNLKFKQTFRFYPRFTAEAEKCITLLYNRGFSQSDSERHQATKYYAEPL